MASLPNWLASWFRSTDTGLSSRSVAWILSGNADIGLAAMGTWGRFYAPSDTSDVGRCVRLFDLAAANGEDWRSRIGEVAAVAPEWVPLAPRWEEIEAAYHEDVAAQQAWTRENGAYHWPRGKSQRALKQQAVARTFPPSRCWWLVSMLDGSGDPYKDRNPHPFAKEAA